MTQIGVLALQGDFREHRQMLDRLGVQTSEVRLPQDLDGVSGLILPGGESTAIVRLMRTSGLLEELQRLSREGLPLWGTCAGMILLAKRLDTSGMPALQAMDITVRRNAFGRQVDSFETDLPVACLEGGATRAVFIRAPYVEAAYEGVEVLSVYNDKIVAVRQGNLLGTAFHPELTDDRRVQQYFLKMVEGG